MKRILLVALYVVSWTMTGCDGTPTDPGSRQPGIRFVSDPPPADTVDAIVPPLVVEVRDSSGRAVAGVVVRFESVRTERGVPSVVVAHPEAERYRAFIVDTTDSRGHARAQVRLGWEAGAGGVAVDVPELGFRDTADYRIEPGGMARVVVEPADSAVYVGSSYALRGEAQDRYGNSRTDPVTYSATNAAVSADGGRLHGESIGRGLVLARSGSVVDTAWVSVVPPGVLTAYQFPIYTNGNGLKIYQAGRVVTLNTDGSEFRVVLEENPAGVPSSYATGMHPTWGPSGDEIFYFKDNSLMATDLSGSTRQVYSGGGSVHSYYSPQVGPSGDWIYFTRYLAGQPLNIWRLRPDGTGVEQIGPTLNWGYQVMPSPDPTGEFVAFHTNRATNSPVDFTIRTLRVSTGEVNPIDAFGESPRWSPTGEWIAYIDNDPHRPYLHLVRPDGSDEHLLGDGIGAHPAFEWSPDGEWLVISGRQPRGVAIYHVGLFLVNASTGEVLPIPLEAELVQPSWRR